MNPNRLVLNFDRENLEFMFLSWESKVLRFILARKEVTSKDVKVHIGDERSRASVIHFLEKITSMGIVVRTTDTCKGGWKGVYTIYSKFKTEYDIIDMFIFRILTHAGRADIKELLSSIR